MADAVRKHFRGGVVTSEDDPRGSVCQPAGEEAQFIVMYSNRFKFRDKTISSNLIESIAGVDAVHSHQKAMLQKQ